MSHRRVEPRHITFPPRQPHRSSGFVSTTRQAGKSKCVESGNNGKVNLGSLLLTPSFSLPNLFHCFLITHQPHIHQQSADGPATPLLNITLPLVQRCIMANFQARELTINKPASPITEQSLSPTTVYSFHTSPHLREAQSFPVALPTTLSSTESDAVQAIPKNRKKPSNSKTVTTLQVLSPFHDCVGQFGKFARLEFRRPNDGFVNGYVKFRWEKRASPQQETLRQVSDSIEAGLWANLPNTIPGATAGSTPRTLLSPATPDFATTNVIDYSPTQSDWSGFSSVSPPDMLPRDVGGALVQTAKPCLLPPQFGFQGKMETNTDRKFWEFCKLHVCCHEAVFGFSMTVASATMGLTCDGT